MCCRVGAQFQCGGWARDSKDSKRTIQLRVVNSAIIACVSSSINGNFMHKGFLKKQSQRRVEAESKNESRRNSEAIH